MEEAVMFNWLQMLTFLLQVEGIDTNAKNADGYTALELAIQMLHDKNIAESFIQINEAADLIERPKNIADRIKYPSSETSKLQNRSVSSSKDDRHNHKGYETAIALAIISLLYVMSTNPSGGFWQDTVYASAADTSIVPHTAGISVMSTNSPVQYKMIYVISGVFLIISVVLLILADDLISWNELSSLRCRFLIAFKLGVALAILNIWQSSIAATAATVTVLSPVEDHFYINNSQAMLLVSLLLYVISLFILLCWPILIAMKRNKRPE
ncbi:hypothetical protein Droror1_Dr00003116 [Drosera rotundifolia]